MLDALALAATAPARRMVAEADQALRCLRHDGFAVVRDVFTTADLREAEGLLDSVLGRFGALVATRRAGARRFAHDMAARNDPSDGSIDQPEILYPASLDPRLTETGLFRKCAAFARAMGGPVSRCFDHVIVKSPWNASVTPWHQDAALTRFRSLPRALQMDRFHFWIPLQDATIENGCMEFIPGSHDAPLLRHERFERANGDIGLRASPDNVEDSKACPVPAGGFTVHTPRTLHHTGRNATARSRKAWIIHFSRLGDQEIKLKRMFGRVPATLTDG